MQKTNTELTTESEVIRDENQEGANTKTRIYNMFKNIIDSFSNNNTTGWADYVDTQYTQSNPFSISANVDTLLPMNGVGGPKTQTPNDISSFITTFNTGSYTSARINGKQGDSYLVTLDLKAIPSSGSATYIEFWFDIGGSIGQLYRRITTFPKGSGQIRLITLTTNVYTLDTWEANGANVYCVSNGDCDIYDIRFVVSRVHKAVQNG